MKTYRLIGNGIFILLVLTIFFTVTYNPAAWAGWPPTMRVAVSLDVPSELEGLYKHGIYLVGINEAGDFLSDVDEEGLSELRAAGFDARVVVSDLKQEWERIRAIGDGEKSEYHSYTELTSDLEALATNYPDICAMSSMGTSVQGRDLWLMKISDNVSANENEAEIRFDGNIHGDEKIGQEVAYLLTELLVEGYGTDPLITELVNTREIWILPCVNPDGMEMGMRYNANYVDCNRDYGYQWNGDGGSPSPLSQPETQAMAEYILARPYSMSMTYHSGTEMFLYSWCYTNDRAPNYLEHEYVQNEYSALSSYTGGQCGHVLYQVNGGSMDYDLGINGALGQCVEISYTKTPPASQIDGYFERNREASLFMIEEAGYGLQGMVTDAATGEPVPAVIRVEGMYVGLRDIGYGDPSLGDYHKYLRAGTYTVQIWANDYELQTIGGVMVVNGEVAELDVELTAAADGYAYRTIICNDTSYGDTNETLTFEALGPPDDYYYSIGVDGYIVLDMGAGTEIWDSEDDDFTIHEATGTEEGYDVYVGNDWRGPWQSVGSGTGTSSFDIYGTGLETARYVKIVDDGDGSSSAPDPGFDLDAVVTTHIIPGCGFLTLDSTKYGCESEIGINLIDQDLNANPMEFETAQVSVTSDTDPSGEYFTLTETGANTGTFEGTAALSAYSSPGTVQVTHGDLVYVLYEDADCQGEPQPVEMTAQVDCVAPAISNVTVEDVSHERAIISWTTDEPADTVVRYGTTYPPSILYFDEFDVEEHQAVLNGLDDCSVYYFEVQSSDAAGNMIVDDNDGYYYDFTTLELHVILWQDMNMNPGWSMDGDWDWGQPTGNGGDYGEPDPTSGYTGNNVCGYNLNGDYPNNMYNTRYMTTGAIDCSGAEQVYLSFWRWLGVEQPTYDHAYIEVSSNGGSSWDVFWENTTTMNGGEWEFVEYDLTQWAAGHFNVKIRWGMGPTDSGWRFCGWNIDDVLVSYTSECIPPTPTIPPFTPTPEPTFTPTSTPTCSPTRTPTDTPITPTATMYPTFSPTTPTPTFYPSFTPEPPSTLTPTSTPEDHPDHVVMNLNLNHETFHAGDEFILTRTGWNPHGTMELDEWIILDVYGSYWFWPDWSVEPDCALVELPSYEYDHQTRLQFDWPTENVGAAEGLKFWGAFLHPQSSILVGEFDVVSFGYE